MIANALIVAAGLVAFIAGYTSGYRQARGRVRDAIFLTEMVKLRSSILSLFRHEDADAAD